MLICARSDDEVLEVLSHTPLWFLIREFCIEQYFWYLRTQFLLPSLTLMQTDISDWKRVYRTMTSISKKEGEKKFTKSSSGDVACLGILLRLGYTPTFRAMDKAIATGTPEAVRFVLQHRQYNSEDQDNYSLGTAIESDNSELVSILIEEGHIDPSAFNSKILDTAASYGAYRCVKRLLEDERIDPTANENAAVLIAIENGHNEVANLILSDRRMVEQGRGRLLDDIQAHIALDVYNCTDGTGNVERWLQELCITDESS